MKLKKITAYIMVFLLTLNLFSHVARGSEVKAAGECTVSAVAEVVPGEADPSLKLLKITYYLSNYEEGTDVEIERSVSRDGVVIESGALVLTASSYSEYFMDDGDYKIDYQLAGDLEQPQTLTQLLDNRAPVVDVAENEDGTIDVTVTDAYLNDNCCQLLYKRVYMNGFDTREVTGSINLSLTPGEGNYCGNISPADTLKQYVGEGIYSDLAVKATDRAQNETGFSLTQSLVVDESAPVISVAVVDSEYNTLVPEVENGTEYYNETSKKILVKIADLQLKEPDCHLVKNGTAFISPEVNSSLEENPYIKELVFPFDQDGKYVLEIYAEDLSEHSIPDQKELIRDTVEPFFEITNTMLSYTDGSRLPAPRHEDEKDIYYLNKEAQISFDVEELNYNTASVSIFENSQLADSYPRLMTENPQSFSRKYKNNGIYQVYATVRDRAGNYCESDVVDFVIDDVKPVISIGGVGNEDMTKEPVTLTFEATDENHDFDEYKITVNRWNIEGFGDVKTYIYSPEEWEDLGENKVKRELVIRKEGNYQVTFDAVDKAGNISSESVFFSIDHTAPVISSVTYSNVSGIILPRHNNIYSNNLIELEFDLYDDVVGVAPGKVYVTLGTEQERTATTPIYLAHKTVGEHYAVYIPTDMGLTEFDSPVTIWANDKLENESTFTSDRVIYTSDYAKIKISCDVDYTRWTNQDVTFHTQIEDRKAGLDQIVYKVNNQVVKSVKFDKLTYEYSYDVTASESAQYVSGYPVEVEVTNNCGTTKKVTRQVYIDKENPIVSLTGIDNGTHYNRDMDFITTIKDISYENTVTKYVIKRTLEGREEQIAAAPFHSSDYENQNVLTMINEGTYEVYAVTEDSAGNTAISNTLQFVIDKTAPQLSITGTSDGTMSGQPVSLLFSCDEIYYDTNTVTIDVECKLDEQTRKYNITGFPNTEKHSSMSHTFSEDGSYIVTMSATDKAGNMAKIQKIAFAIDRTKPEIRIEGTTNYRLWNTPPSISFVVEESYFSTNQVSISGTRRDIDGRVHDIVIHDFASSGRVSRLSHIFNEDGIYHLILTSKDEAGNMSRQEIHFTIDKTAPDIFLVDQFQGGYYHDFRLTDNIENVFRDLTVISYKILLNGVEYNGTDRITDEGKYNLYVEVTDELGHMSSAVAEFIIDHTAPKVIFAGVKDGQTVYEEGNVILTLTNAEDEITSVRLNGEELGAQVRNVPYTQQGSYQIDVDCIDKAGNQITRSIYFVYSRPIVILLVGAGAGVVVLLTCVWLWMSLRKRKKKEN